MVSYFDDTVNKRQSLKKIKDPDDETNFVLIPVTDQIAFKDPKTEGQEIAIRWDLTETGGRIFHVHRVKRKTGTPDDYTEDEDVYIEVERIDRVGIVDPKTNAQGYAFRLDNRDTEDSWPALPGVLRNFNLEHVRHVVRYTADNTLEGEPWVDVELIDLFPVRDPKSDAQEHIYRITYAEKGDPIGDEDDPYLPTFAISDRNLTTVERAQDSIIDPPYRTSPFENIVNFSFGGVAEFELDTKDPHILQVGGPGEEGQAVIQKEANSIDDFTKATFSLWFNITDSGESSLRSCGLVQWGGRTGESFHTFDGEGYPDSSYIRVSTDPREETLSLNVLINLIGPVFNTTIEAKDNWYLHHTGETIAAGWGSFNPSPGFGIEDYDPDGTSGKARGGAGLMHLRLGGIREAWRNELTRAPAENPFLGKWHHLLVSFDASGVSFDDVDHDFQWDWVEEAWGFPDDTSTPESPLEYSDVTPFRSSYLQDHLYLGNISRVLADTVVIDGRGFGNGTNTAENARMALADWAGPIPGRVALYCIATLYESEIAGYPLGELVGATMVATYVQFGHAIGDKTTEFPCHMMLDGKLHRGDPNDSPPRPDPQNVAEYNAEVLDNIFDFSPIGGGGFLIKGESLKPLSIPRQQQPFDTADTLPPSSAVTRFAKVQMWFDTFVDLTDANNLKKFFETFTPDLDPDHPENHVLSIRPAKFTPEEAAEVALIQPPEDRPISPAELAFGEPDIQLDGGPPAVNAVSGLAIMPLSGFGKNRGKGGTFEQVNDIESFSPGPRRISKPT